MEPKQLDFKYHYEALGKLREAVAFMKDARVDLSSRELSIAITEAEAAVLWLQRDIQLQTPPEDLEGPADFPDEEE